MVNTYVRHGKRWPPQDTRYLAGELLGHVAADAPCAEQEDSAEVSARSGTRTRKP